MDAIGVGKRPTVASFHRERTINDFLLTLMYDKLFERFPNLRVASIENGSEFLGDLFRKLAQVPRPPAAATTPRIRSNCSAARVDQPVLGGRHGRGDRPHGRRPGDLRIGLAAHGGSGPAARHPGRARRDRGRRLAKILYDNTAALNQRRPA